MYVAEGLTAVLDMRQPGWPVIGRHVLTAVRLPDETYDHLRSLAARTNRTTTFYIREAVNEYLEEMEDRYSAEQTLIEHRKSGERALSLDELDTELGILED